MKYLRPNIEHEQVVTDTLAGGIQCIIAIHSTRLGPALGGTRLLHYPDFAAALSDALRLSTAMTFKAAGANLPTGGGKAVIIGDPRDKSEALFRSFGQFVNELHGSYIAACDMNVDPGDLRAAREESPWIHGLYRADGGSGDSSEMTAYGVYLGIKACLQHATGSSRLADRTVAIDGVGKVGGRLARMLCVDGARILASDRDNAATAEVAATCGATILSRGELYRANVDVISPNATGGSVTAEVADSLQCLIIAGAANNQLESEHSAEVLKSRGILYAPDFIINAGGLIQVVDELHAHGPSDARTQHQTELIPDRLRGIFSHADRADTTPLAAAHWLARSILEQSVPAARQRAGSLESVGERTEDAAANGCHECSFYAQ